MTYQCESGPAPFAAAPKQQQLAMSRHASPRGGFLFPVRVTLTTLEIARVLVRLDHITNTS
jgi:hypothetical protein